MQTTKILKNQMIKKALEELKPRTIIFGKRLKISLGDHVITNMIEYTKKVIDKTSKVC